jgi:hypothetical protein
MSCPQMDVIKQRQRNYVKAGIAGKGIIISKYHEC